MKEVTGICVIRGKEEYSIFGTAHRLLSLSVSPHPKFLRWRPSLYLGPGVHFQAFQCGLSLCPGTPTRFQHAKDMHVSLGWVNRGF